MGIFKPMSSGDGDLCYSLNVPTMPDANDYTIGREISYGGFVVMRVKYHGVTNYEGTKILVYREDELAKLRKWAGPKTPLDPHFMEKKVSPIARFEPTEEGWKMATRFIEAMVEIE